MSKKFPWQRKKVLIAGLGTLGGGLETTKFFVKNGAFVTVTDLKAKEELRSSLSKLQGLPIKFTLGRHSASDFQNQDLIIRNPAMPKESPYLELARANGIPIMMESTVFFTICSSNNIIGVTGTKGKTTTVFLIKKILEKAKKDVLIGGNPQNPILSLLPKIKKETWIVLELSSWQLEGLADYNISPHIAIITNIMHDHLNRYANMDDYISAKKNIFKFQNEDDFFITNGESKICRNLAEEAKSQVYYFNSHTLPEKIKRAVKLQGLHNLSNVACSYVLSQVLKIDDSYVLDAVSEFRGVDGRLEFVQNIKGVDFINDTCATIPEATIAAVESFTSPVILICGGADKNLDFVQFGKIISRKVKYVVLIEGTATDKIEKEIPAEKILGRFNNFRLAIQKAYENAKRGDKVLLSPACASFGMFKNEFDRGEQFKKIVNQLIT